jgi:hypothetical protein
MLALDICFSTTPQEVSIFCKVPDELQKDFTSIHFRDRITTKYARAKNNQKFIPQRSRRYSLLKPLAVVGLFGTRC